LEVHLTCRQCIDIEIVVRIFAPTLIILKGIDKLKNINSIKYIFIEWVVNTVPKRTAHTAHIVQRNSQVEIILGDIFKQCMVMVTHINVMIVSLHQTEKITSPPTL
jgi:hypothetical protein